MRVKTKTGIVGTDMQSSIHLLDRVFRSLFVALAVGLGWGIRGDFGHMLGAMYPGAALGLAFAFVTGQKSAFKWMPVLGLFGGLGISLGGMMSYGILHGYAKADTLINYSYGFFTLVLQGGAWGGFGCALLGLILEKKRLRLEEWASLVATVLAFGWTAYQIVVTLLAFHINPPRSDLSIGYTGGIVGLFVWLVLKGKGYGLKGAFFGYLGFGLGMAGGRLLANASYQLPFAINNWNIMEVSCGLIGGFVFAFGMLGKEVPEFPEDGWHPLLSKLGILYVMAGIPLYHRLLRSDPGQRLEEWANSAKSLGIEDPSAFAERTLFTLHAVCLLGFLGAGLWLWLHLKNKTRLAAFPILFFSLVMLLFQNTNALYFWRPPAENGVNMHTVFWVLFGLMVLYVLIARPSASIDPDEVAEDLNWRRWTVGAVAAYVLIVAFAGFVNGEKTMASANTRFPLWSWRDGQ